MNCSNCGKTLKEGAKFCSGCGMAIQHKADMQAMSAEVLNINPTLLHKLSSKLKVNSLIWFIIAFPQILIGLALFIAGLVNIDDELVFLLIAAGPFLFIGITNFVMAYKQLEWADDILTNPIQILSRYDYRGRFIWNLFYNTIFGAFIGLIGSIHTFTIRNFVTTYRHEFINIEKSTTRVAGWNNV